LVHGKIFRTRILSAVVPSMISYMVELLYNHHTQVVSDQLASCILFVKHLVYLIDTLFSGINNVITYAIQASVDGDNNLMTALVSCFQCIPLIPNEDTQRTAFTIAQKLVQSNHEIFGSFINDQLQKVHSVSNFKFHFFYFFSTSQNII